jgi:4-amino-4-deoxy-L-arabinose transferase-like glycosyltransferase
MIINRFFWWIILLLFLLVVALSLDLPMVVNAAKYAQVSREIVESGDWINLTIAGDPYDQKPPLLFWIGAVFFQLFGVSAAVWKIAVILASLGGIYSTYQLGRLLYDELTGRFAALFWAVSLGYLYFHNDIHTDTLLADTVIFSIWQLASYFKGKKPVHFYLGMAGIGLSMLAKGPVGLAIPAFAVGIHLALHRKWKEIFHPRWLTGAVVVFIMIIPALAGLFNQFGPEGIKFYFWTNNMGRITGSYAGKNSDPFFYIHTSLYMLAPFTVFALSGLGRTIGKVFSSWKKFPAHDEFYTLGGILPYLLILSVAKAKNPHYLIAVIPLLMILAAAFTMALASAKTSSTTRKTVSFLNVFITCLLWVIIAVFGLWLFPEMKFMVWAGIAIIAGLLYYFWRNYRGISRQIAILALSMMAFMFSLNASIYPRMVQYHSPVHALKDYNEQSAQGEEIHCYLPPSRYWEIFFYASNPGRYYVTEEELPQLLNEKKDWVFTDENGKNQIIGRNPDTIIAGEYDHSSLSKITLPFLIPSTRAGKLQKRYLLHLP